MPLTNLCISVTLSNLKKIRTLYQKSNLLTKIYPKSLSLTLTITNKNAEITISSVATGLPISCADCMIMIQLSFKIDSSCLDKDFFKLISLESLNIS